MFTGIIEEVGKVSSLEQRSAGASLSIVCESILRDLSIGDSISVNGACLTAIEIGADHWTADLAPETLKRTSLGDLKAGGLVNLERPLRANGRLDGHFVLGHVDGTAELVSLDPLGDDNWWLRIRVPADLSRYIVSKGSLAVDGISLTVAEMADDLVSFTIIPHTYEQTRLHVCSPGFRMNIEVDILAKHLEKLAAVDSVRTSVKTFHP
jgi:riboflavin synthase